MPPWRSTCSILRICRKRMPLRRRWCGAEGARLGSAVHAGPRAGRWHGCPCPCPSQASTLGGEAGYMSVPTGAWESPSQAQPPRACSESAHTGLSWGSARYLQIPSVPRLPSGGAPRVTPVCRWAGCVPRWSGYHPSPGSSEALVLGQNLGLPEASWVEPCPPHLPAPTLLHPSQHMAQRPRGQWAPRHLASEQGGWGVRPPTAQEGCSGWGGMAGRACGTDAPDGRRGKHLPLGAHAEDHHGGHDHDEVCGVQERGSLS